MDITSLYTAVSDMTNLRKSVIVDMIMVQLIALTLGCFLILVFSGPKMSSTDLSWIIGALFVCFSATGIVYRRLGQQG
tara:strand:+ start:8687 stop:8920 length:234 start_codon:yes stop_codon:yes gene_type:complete